MPRHTPVVQNFAAEREILENWIPADSSRPLYTNIRTAFIERLPRYQHLLAETVSKRPAKRTAASSQMLKRVVSELKRLDAECNLLAVLLLKRSNLWAARDWRKPQILKFLLRFMKAPRGGRPSTKLQTAMLVKEKRLADSKRWTWKKLTAEHCNCGNKHDIHCQDNLRREVQQLEKALTRLHISP